MYKSVSGLSLRFVAKEDSEDIYLVNEQEMIFLAKLEETIDEFLPKNDSVTILATASGLLACHLQTKEHLSEELKYFYYDSFTNCLTAEFETIKIDMFLKVEDEQEPEIVVISHINITTKINNYSG